MNEHRPEVADVFRTYEGEFLAQWGRVLNPQQRKAFQAIRDCRTAALGRHAEYAEQCDTCGHLAISYNSCRDRHCPKCQGSSRAKWLAARQSEVLPAVGDTVRVRVWPPAGFRAFNSFAMDYSITRCMRWASRRPWPLRVRRPRPGWSARCSCIAGAAFSAKMYAEMNR